MKSGSPTYCDPKSTSANLHTDNRTIIHDIYVIMFAVLPKCVNVLMMVLDEKPHDQKGFSSADDELANILWQSVH